MKKIFIVLFVLIGFKGISQDLSLGLYGGINLNKEIIEYNNSNNSMPTIYFTPSSSKQNKIDFEIGNNIGLSIDYLFKKKLLFEIGLNHNIIKTSSFFGNYYYSTSDETWYDSEGQIIFIDGQYETIPVNKKLYTKHKNISIPVKLGYVFGNKFKIIPKIGISTSYTIKSYFDDIEINETTKEVLIKNTYSIGFYNRYNVNILSEIELRYNFFRNFNVFSNIDYHYSILPINSYQNYSKNFHSGFDFNFGVKYNLKK